MEPISSRNRSESEPGEPTAAEVEAGACLPREPEPVQSRLVDQPTQRPRAVVALVDKQLPVTSTGSATRSPAAGSAGKTSHPGVALSVGVNLAVAGKGMGGEASLGIVVDLGEPSISLFTSSGRGTAAAPTLSAGVSGQVSLIADATKFSGSGQELGVNSTRASGSFNFSSATPGGPIELNGVTGSYGTGIGMDAHYFDTTTKVWTLSDLADAAVQGVQDVREALRRAAQLPGPRRFGP